jgi:hydrogenase maturation protease
VDEAKPRAFQPCIIGYGNPFRRDDGIGVFVAERLRSLLCQGTRILTSHQLDPVLLDEVQDSDLVVFVDATGKELREGIQWDKIRPERSGFAHTTHHFKPSLLLDLLSLLHHKEPEAWLMSIQGDDFGYGEGLTDQAVARADKACRRITEFITGKTVDKGKASIHIGVTNGAKHD